MSTQERTAWDQRFRVGSHAGSPPDPFLEQLEEYSSLFSPSRCALDVACGAGRHAVWLAERGWHVTGLDISVEGLRRARTLAQQRAVPLDLVCTDLEMCPLPVERFDLIVCFFYLQKNLFEPLQRALRPGGLIVYKTYTTDQSRFPGCPSHPLHLLHPQELLARFGNFRVLLYQETVQDRGVAQLIAQRPREQS
jgi:SAM-dependent methyltransferase